jgi:hypothetical protein
MTTIRKMALFHHQLQIPKHGHFHHVSLLSWSQLITIAPLILFLLIQAPILGIDNCEHTLLRVRFFVEIDRELYGFVKT